MDLALPLLISAFVAPAAVAARAQQGHEEWIMQGWDRRTGTAPFVFARKLDRDDDLHDPQGVFWDNFASDASTCGSNRKPLHAQAKSILHVKTDAHEKLVGKDIASTAVAFVGRLERGVA